MTITSVELARTGPPLCDMCGSSKSLLLAKANPHRLDTYFCRDCALVYGWPRPPASDLENFYDDEFTGDGGALAAPGGTIATGYLKKEERTVQQWSGPFVAAALDLRNARVVDLRGRTGALARFMADAGADVLHTDPFPANVAYAAEQRGLRAQGLKLTEAGTMADLPANSFDAVVALSVHLLAHVLSPREALAGIRNVLKPGGLLLMDEKDIAHPVRYKNGSIFSSGRAHLFHFTVETFASAVARAGFEIVSCEIDAKRATGFQHIKLVARKPTGTPAGEASWHSAEPEKVLAKLKRAERGKWLALAKHTLARAAKVVAKRKA